MFKGCHQLKEKIGQDSKREGMVGSMAVSGKRYCNCLQTLLGRLQRDVGFLWLFYAVSEARIKINI